MLPKEKAEVKYDSKCLTVTLGSIEALKDCVFKGDFSSLEYKMYKDFILNGLTYFERLQEHRNKIDGK